MLHNAIGIRHSMKLEFTRVGLLVEYSFRFCIGLYRSH